MVIKAEKYSGFSQEISEAQAKVLLNLLEGMCDKNEQIAFLSSLPKDLEEKVFFSKEKVYSFSGWQYGILCAKHDNLNLIRNLWSFSYGTPLYFMPILDVQDKTFEVVKLLIIKLKKNISGMLSFFTYVSPEKTEAPVLLEYFKKVVVRGHDGEMVEVYRAKTGPNIKP